MGRKERSVRGEKAKLLGETVEAEHCDADSPESEIPLSVY